MKAGDKIDNDCDGLTDEEVLDGIGKYAAIYFVSVTAMLLQPLELRNYVVLMLLQVVSYSPVRVQRSPLT